ncbi:hypothetical protein STCU_10543 [Strigomonas culicis]|uniref:Uncharacterized protein n=1 Tax=Strigomonas culicis TaxID=28005 RepID=S9V3W6_9TRYP|nr:hypothetical protein STCU_10543 [Strigomonas culicis]|eukprot:EPY17545.1 hypothetical protein STCU_10543 [Strigomonas culicis]
MLFVQLRAQLELRRRLDTCDVQLRVWPELSLPLRVHPWTAAGGARRHRERDKVNARKGDGQFGHADTGHNRISAYVEGHERHDAASHRWHSLHVKDAPRAPQLSRRHPFHPDLTGPVRLLSRHCGRGLSAPEGGRCRCRLGLCGRPTRRSDCDNMRMWLWGGSRSAPGGGRCRCRRRLRGRSGGRPTRRSDCVNMLMWLWRGSRSAPLGGLCLFVLPLRDGLSGRPTRPSGQLCFFWLPLWSWLSDRHTDPSGCVRVMLFRGLCRNISIGGLCRWRLGLQGSSGGHHSGRSGRVSIRLKLRGRHRRDGILVGGRCRCCLRR